MYLFIAKPLKTLCSVLIILSIIIGSGLLCTAANNLKFSNGRLTLSVKNQPLIPLLEEIAKTTNVVIFISKELNPGKISARINNMPLNKALSKLLKGFNVAMVYHKQHGKTRVTAVNIYPKGRFNGPMDVVIQSSRPQNISASGQRHTRYAKDSTDILSPEEYVHTVKYDSLVPQALKFEKEEKDAWKDIQDLKNQVNKEVDKTKNNVLSLALLDKYEAFEKMQTEHVNILENLHRLEHFYKSRAQQKQGGAANKSIHN